MTTTSTHTWYAAKMGNDFQGLVVDEKTGANIAVAYDKAHTALLAAAPELLAALIEARHQMDQAALDLEHIGMTPLKTAIRIANAAIAKAKGL